MLIFQFMAWWCLAVKLISVSSRNNPQARQDSIITRVEYVSKKLTAYISLILWIAKNATKSFVKCLIIYWDFFAHHKLVSYFCDSSQQLTKIKYYVWTFHSGPSSSFDAMIGDGSNWLMWRVLMTGNTTLICLVELTV